MRTARCRWLLSAVAVAVVWGAIAHAADDVALRRQIQAIYDRASAASVRARTLADLDAIHSWLDTADCEYANFGRPRRTWSQMRMYAADDLRTRMKSLVSEIIALDVQGSTATATTLVRGVASVPDAAGRFGTIGAIHDVETTATVRDVWVAADGTWRRRSHEKVVANRITAVDRKPVR